MSRSATQAIGDRQAPSGLPRLGFLGVGWIGTSRLRSLVRSEACRVAGIADPSEACLATAIEHVPHAAVCRDLDDLLALEPDGVVIATPSALHADQATRALERGCAVFCQKPLARTEAEARRVIEAARSADRLLGVDLSYRHTRAFEQVAGAIASGELGEIYAADLTFHNAYGPDKAWFRDPALAGGGCVIDLGIHLVDLALGALGWPSVTSVDSHLYSRGRRIDDAPGLVEDYAVASMVTEHGQTLRLACSWNLHAGRDAVLDVTFYGTRAAAGFANVDGSFYDFTATLDRGTHRQVLCTPPDDWGGRAAVAWVKRLAQSRRFDPQAERFAAASAVIDRIYRR